MEPAFNIPCCFIHQDLTTCVRVAQLVLSKRDLQGYSSFVMIFEINDLTRLNIEVF